MENNFKYILFKNVINIFLDNKKYIVNDPSKVEKIKEMIDRKEYESVMEEVDPFYGLKDFSINNNLVSYKNEDIPEVLSNYFIKKQIGKKHFVSLANFWFNIKNRFEYSECLNIIEKIVSTESYPFTEDGFCFASNKYNFSNDKIKSVSLSNLKIKEKYNYIKKETLNLEEIVNLLSSRKSKKIQNLYYEMIVKYNNLTFVDFLNYVLSFLDEDKAIETIKKDPSVDFPNENYIEKLDLFFNGIPNQRKYKFLIADRYKLWQAISTFSEIKSSGIEIDISDKKNLDSVVDHLLFQKTIIKNLISRKNLNFDLNKELMSIDNVIFDNYKFVIPKDNYKLVEWSNKLGICIGTEQSYTENSINGHIYLIGIYDLDKEEIVYNLEIRSVDKSLNQFRQRANGKPPESIFNKICEFLKEKNIINSYNYLRC